MVCEHGSDAEARGFSQFVQSEAGHKAMDMQDVGATLGEPAMEQLRTPGGSLPLSLVASRRGRDRIPKNRSPVVPIIGSAVATSFWSCDVDVMPRLAQATAEAGHVDLSAPKTLGVVPAKGVGDSHPCSLASGCGVPAAV